MKKEKTSLLAGTKLPSGIKKAAILLAFLYAEGVSGQSLSPYVIASAGESYAGTSFSMDYTLGETPAVTTLAGGVLILTQGFQQPFAKTTGIEIRENDSTVSLSIYPNPASSQLQVKYNAGKTNVKTEIRIYNVLGNVLYGRVFYSTPDSTGIEYLDVSAFPDGTYFISVTVEYPGGTRKQYTERLVIMKY